MTQEVIVGLTAEQAVMVKPPSRRVWPGASAPPEVILSLRTRRAIDPIFDITVELSMKAPMSVLKPGRGSRTVRLRRMVTGGWGHDVYAGSGPLDGGNTLRPA